MDNISALLHDIDKLKALLRKYAVIKHTGNNVSCNCCHHFGLHTHKDGCELAPYVTLVKGSCFDGDCDAPRK